MSKFKIAVILSVFVTGLVLLFVFDVFTEQTKGVSIIVSNTSSVDSIYTPDSNVVLPVIYTHVPDLRDMHYKERMHKFIDMMLPSVLLASEKMHLKRENILEINSAVKSGVASKGDSIYLNEIKSEYKTDNIDEIIQRLHPHPISIILAQAAIESGWATSRFCREGNNVFGIWSYNSNEKRLKANNDRKGTSVYLRKYDSLFESIYDYLETIARANAYKQFREVRLYSDNPFRLIWYLSNYSEKRYEYVHSLRNVIEFNDLQKYDTYQLAEINKNDKVWLQLLE